MYYLDISTINRSIHDLSSVEHVGGKAAHKDLLAFYLILKLRGLKANTWVLSENIYDRDGLIEAMLLMGGLASPEEKPGKKACMFFTSFKKAQETENKEGFYNPSSAFKSLPSRLKDTIDNSAIDSLGSKSQGSLKFQRDSTEKLLENYSTKFNLFSLIVWIYRFKAFDIQYTANELKRMFQKQFYLTDNEVLEIFGTSLNYELTYTREMVSFEDIRKILKVESLVELNKDKLEYEISDLNINKFHTELSMLFNSNINSKDLKDILLSYKQLILTGVPGVGKSYFIRELDEFDLFFVQFHQNYTYQDFIAGKTIVNGEVEPTTGDLITAIEQANSIKAREGKLLLVLDEINRGNISSIFGELMYMLDRNGNSVKISALGGMELTLPDNLYILGTMNSSDRSIAVIDYALRRRFPFVKLLPNYDLVNSHVLVRDSENKDFNQLGGFLNILNIKIANYFNNSDYQFGHALFLKENYKTEEDQFVISTTQLLYIIFYEIIPMLIEYNNGDESFIVELLSEEILNANASNIIDAIKVFLGQESCYSE
ncbi:McrB family protein [Psychrobacter frigidicola]|uniref:McrB family protein n=1 Tax=Psychrobacter frigidicola TaxID=45611 RepID=UPI00191A28EE|nr:AAA family ATPase [Psychrobacter frigidicola]